MIFRKHFIVSYIGLFFGFNALSQHISISVGTDIPYQHYIGVNLETPRIDIYYRTGILSSPYSNTILDIIEELGTNQDYINLLDNAFDFGWMNSIGTYYKFGKKKYWYIGAELRSDYLTAADTPQALIETVTGQSFDFLSFTADNKLKLGVQMVALGLRVGRMFSISLNDKHHIRVEFSVNKYVSTKSELTIDSEKVFFLNDRLDSLLWEDVFKPYGYVGGIGIGYSYKF